MDNRIEKTFEMLNNGFNEENKDEENNKSNSLCFMWLVSVIDTCRDYFHNTIV